MNEISVRIGNLYWASDGSMIDLDEVIAAKWGNRENDVVFVRVRGDASEHGLVIRPGGGDFLQALRARRFDASGIPDED